MTTWRPAARTWVINSAATFCYGLSYTPTTVPHAASSRSSSSTRGATVTNAQSSRQWTTPTYATCPQASGYEHSDFSMTELVGIEARTLTQVIAAMPVID